MNEYSITVNGATIVTDKEGYLQDSEQWNEDVAKYIASIEGIDMTPERWQIVHFVRNFYITYDTSPAMRALVKALQVSHGAEKGNSRYLYRLFPKGPAKIPTKLAGLPKPAKCL